MGVKVVAQVSVLTAGQLDPGLILSPERYDPRRQTGTGPAGTPLESIALIVSEQVNPKNIDSDAQLLVLDTSDAREGVILTTKQPIAAADLGSSKKSTRPGDVIISRLRPYLRQVATIDDGIAGHDVEVVCSTEFFVLRSADGKDIAFLAAWLLSSGVQQMLGVSQEGGHHPRFNATTLIDLRVPDAVVAIRDSLSLAVSRAALQARGAEQAMRRLVESCESAIS
jgi:hypothetical protein